MKRSTSIGIFAIALIIAFIAFFLLRQNPFTTGHGPTEGRLTPINKLPPQSKPNTTDQKSTKTSALIQSLTSRTAAIPSSGRAPISRIDDLRALAAVSKQEAELCSRKQLDPIAKKFQRLVNEPDGVKYLRQAEDLAAKLGDIPTIAPSSSRERLREDARKDIEALSAGGETAKAFRSELEKTELLRAKINEALKQF